jgi:integrase
MLPIVFVEAPSLPRVAGPVLRDGNYSIRINIPTDLRRHYPSKTGTPRPQIWISLKTSDAKEAKARANLVRTKWDREFKAKRREVTPLDVVELQGVAHRHYTALERLDDDLRMKPATDADLDAVWKALEREYGEHSLEALGIFRLVERAIREPKRVRDEERLEMRAEGAASHASVEHEARAVVAELGLGAEPGSEDFNRISLALKRAKVEAHKRADERDDFDWTGEVRDPMVKKPVVERAKAGEGIMDLVDLYVAENPDNIRPDTLRQTRDAVRLFVESLPPRSTVKAITKQAVRDWKALLMKFPVRAVDTKAFKGMAIREVVAENERLGKTVITRKTINRYLSGLGGFSNWLVVRGDLDVNPVRDLYLKIDKSRVTTMPFTVDQMTAVFSSKAFQALQGYQYWIPLVMAFSGARPGELAQLLVKDVRERFGHQVMQITPEGGEGKTLKTKNSARPVPVHPELVRLGFLKHVEAMRAAGETRVFPDAERNSRGQWIDKFSREFPRLLTRLGVKSGRGLSLYSFRHSAVDALRRAGIADETFQPLIGHAKFTTTGIYGTESEGTIDQRAGMIDAIVYAGLVVPRPL